MICLKYYNSLLFCHVLVKSEKGIDPLMATPLEGTVVGISVAMLLGR